jgi:hypothetical protein
MTAMSHAPLSRSLAAATLVAAWVTLFAPMAAADDVLDRAQAAFAAGRWEEAAKLFGDVVKADPKTAVGEFRLAVSLLNLKQPEAARPHLDASEKLGWPPAGISYRRAALFAQTGDMDRAFALLDDAAAKGLPATLPQQPDALLAPMKADARFKTFLETLDRRDHPCRHDPHYRDFDFWLGEWDVRPPGSPANAPAAENIITQEYEGCVLQEHWKPGGAGSSGGGGSSFNIYDSTRKMWFQTWVDATGGLHEYHGNLDADGNMAFTGETPGAPGQPARVPTKLTFFRLGPDQVRQLSEVSTDGGKTWTTNYDLIYTRRKSAAAATTTK